MRILMYMAFLATAITNDFLQLAEQDGRPLTQMQIQKLIYFSHGWSLALNDQPLSIERFEAWDYGPVIRRLWERLRRYGSKPVTELVCDYALVNGKFKTFHPTMETSKTVTSIGTSMDIVRTVWRKYGHFSAIELSELTHIPEGPWAAARKSGEPYIPDRSIKKYFSTLRKVAP